MRTLHVEMGRHRLGGTMQVFYLLRGLSERGIEAALVCPKDSPLQEMVTKLGIRVFAIPYIGDIDLRFPFRLRKIIHQVRPDIIHLHSRRGADTLGLLAARTAGQGKIIISRRVDNPIKKGWLTDLRFQKLCDHVIAVSKGIAQELIKAGIPPEHISQVYSAIDVAAYQSKLSKEEARKKLNLPIDAPVIMAIGQLIPRKGHRYLLETAPTILGIHPKTRFVIVGEGKEENTLKKLARSLEISDSVLFTGYRDDIADLLKSADILVHPATMEGFANVALQAMASGVPIVSTSVGGMPESVRNGVNGILVPPKDIKRLSAAINTLIYSPSLRKKMGEAGRSIVQREFHVDAMVEGNLRVYNNILRK